MVKLTISLQWDFLLQETFDLPYCVNPWCKSSNQFRILKFFSGNMTAVAEQEDPELTSSHGHTKIATIHRTTIDENELKTSRTDFPQLKL